MFYIYNDSYEKTLFYKKNTSEMKHLSNLKIEKSIEILKVVANEIDTVFNLIV